MIRLIVVLAIMVIPMVGVKGIFAQEQKTQIDEWLERCIEQDPSTAGMNNCTYKAYEMWDKELNAVYRQLMKKLDPNAQKLLKEAEIAWIKYRDAELRLQDAIYGQMQGSMWATMAAGNRYDFVKQRTLALKAYLDMIGE